MQMTADLGEDDQRQYAEHREDRGEQDAGAGDHAAGGGQGAQHSVAGAVGDGLLAGPGDEEDVVVDAEGDQEQEASSGTPASSASKPRPG